MEGWEGGITQADMSQFSGTKEGKRWGEWVKYNEEQVMDDFKRRDLKIKVKVGTSVQKGENQEGNLKQKNNELSSEWGNGSRRVTEQFTKEAKVECLTQI